MLLGNYHPNQKLPLMVRGGSTTGEQGVRSNIGKSGQRNLLLPSDGFNAIKTYAKPTGYVAGAGAWFIPQISGEIGASNGTLSGTGSASPITLLGGLNGVADLFGSADIISGGLSLIAFGIASIVGSGQLGALDAQLLVSIQAAISSSGDVADSNIAGIGYAFAVLLGTSDIEAQQYAAGIISSNIRGYSDMTPEGIRDAVWNAIALQFDKTGTMGLLLQTVSSGGGATPQQIWEYILAGAGKSAKTILEEQNAKALTVEKFLALK